VVDNVYDSGIDTTIGRVSALADAGGSAAGNRQSYVYQGVATVVGNADGNGVTETTTLDNFGRTAEMDYVSLSTGLSTDDFQYGYDRDGNVLYKNNALDGAESELYHANSTTTADDNAAYDPLNRLTGCERGTLSSSGNNGSALDTVASPSASQSWNLNAVGDQSSVTTNGATTTNSTNAKNELNTNGANSLTFDNNGNETTDENGQTTTYDAWNRGITVKNAAGTTIASYSYDPTGRRITESSGGVTTDIYFTNQWQDIEERQGGTVTRQNVWGLGYVNQLVERDDNSTSGNLGITGSGLGERLYAQQDANWNVTSLVDASGNVVQRMVYSPYGAVTFLRASWSSAGDAYAQSVLFQGGTLETATRNYIFDNRDYDPTTATWKEQDPAGFVDGEDRYQADVSAPPSQADPTGTEVFGPPDPRTNTYARAHIGKVAIDPENGFTYDTTIQFNPQVFTGSIWTMLTTSITQVIDQQGKTVWSRTQNTIDISTLPPNQNGTLQIVDHAQGDLANDVHVAIARTGQQNLGACAKVVETRYSHWRIAQNVTYLDTATGKNVRWTDLGHQSVVIYQSSEAYIDADGQQRSVAPHIVDNPSTLHNVAQGSMEMDPVAGGFSGFIRHSMTFELSTHTATYDVTTGGAGVIGNTKNSPPEGVPFEVEQVRL